MPNTIIPQLIGCNIIYFLRKRKQVLFVSIISFNSISFPINYLIYLLYIFIIIIYLFCFVLFCYIYCISFIINILIISILHYIFPYFPFSCTIFGYLCPSSSHPGSISFFNLFCSVGNGLFRSFSCCTF